MDRREDIDLARLTSIGFEEAHRLARREQARTVGRLWNALRARLTRPGPRAPVDGLRTCTD